MGVRENRRKFTFLKEEKFFNVLSAQGEKLFIYKSGKTSLRNLFRKVGNLLLP